MSPVTAYTTAALLALVAVTNTALCLAWSIPAGRRRLAKARAPRGGDLSGWPARVGGGLVSAGIAGCALTARYRLYRALAAI